MTAAGPPWVITVDRHPPTLNARLHWAERHRLCTPVKEAVAWQALAISMRLREPLEHARVVATLVYDRGPLKDYDNAVTSLKPILDGLVVGRLLVDDSPAHLELVVDQRFGARRCVVLEVTPLEPTTEPSDSESAPNPAAAGSGAIVSQHVPGAAAGRPRVE